MRLRGMNGSKKSKRYFIDQKIPAHLRKTWPLVTDSSGEILWLVGLKKSGEVRMDLQGLGFGCIMKIKQKRRRSRHAQRN